jgi:transposase
VAIGRVNNVGHLRRQIEARGAAPNMPPKINRRWKRAAFRPSCIANRSAIERMFGLITDFRRIATRYDKLARNFLAISSLPSATGYEFGAW